MYLYIYVSTSVSLCLYEYASSHKQGFQDVGILYVTVLGEQLYPHMRTNKEALEHKARDTCWGKFLDYKGDKCLLAVADGVHRTCASVMAVNEGWLPEDTTVNSHIHNVIVSTEPRHCFLSNFTMSCTSYRKQTYTMQVLVNVVAPDTAVQTLKEFSMVNLSMCYVHMMCNVSCICVCVCLCL